MNIIKLIRYEHWLKNLFIFLPVFFGGQIFNLDAVLPCCYIFIAFSFIASSIYCFNDIFDIEIDKFHPRKCKRPIASGALSIKTAIIIMILCLLISFTIVTLVPAKQFFKVFALFIFYFVMNILYTIRLKNYAIVDVIIIAVGFVIRINIGGAVTGIVISEWIVIMTFLLALFLAFAKRLDDVILYKDTGINHRENTYNYNLDFLNQVISILATITIVAYILYTLSPEVTERFQSKYLYYTSIFVLMGIFRYLQLTIVHKKSGNPTYILLHDKFIQLCISGWFGLFIGIIYI